MLKIKMQTGPCEQIYYCEENQTGMHQIVQLTFVDKEKATTQVIYTSDSALILAFSCHILGTTLSVNG